MDLSPRNDQQRINSDEAPLKALEARVSTLEIANKTLLQLCEQQHHELLELRALVNQVGSVVEHGIKKVNANIAALSDKVDSKIPAPPSPATPPTAPAAPAMSYSKALNANAPDLAVPMPTPAPPPPPPPPSTHATMKTMRLVPTKPGTLPPMCMAAINMATPLLEHMGFQKHQFQHLEIATQTKPAAAGTQRVPIAILITMPEHWSYQLPREFTDPEQVTWRIRPHLAPEEFKNRLALWAANAEDLKKETSAGRRLRYLNKYTQVQLENGDILPRTMSPTPSETA
jgi:hypothetical protein